MQELTFSDWLGLAGIIVSLWSAPRLTGHAG